MQLLKHVFRLIFPSWCELCGYASEGAVCESCVSRLVRMDNPYCPRCSEKLDSGMSVPPDCYHCRDERYYFDYAVAVYQMNEELRTLIHNFKYKRALYMGEFLGSRMQQAFLDERLSDLDLSEWVVTSVPLHFIRQRKRYFNQSEILAQHLAADLDIPYAPLLERVVPTPHQARLSKRARAKNVEKAFEVKEHAKSFQKVIIVDDVFTTGATVNACAKELTEAGVEHVIVLCLARK